MESIQQYMQAVGADARAASKKIAAATVASRNAALIAIKDAIARNREMLLKANR